MTFTLRVLLFSAVCLIICFGRGSSQVRVSPREGYEEQQQVTSRKYFAEEEKCRNLIRAQNWKEAEPVCKATTRLADQLSSDRELEKSGAYEYVGLVMMGQKRYQEAIDYFNRALEFVRTRLTEKNAELGQLYGEEAIAYHGLGDLAKARELYRRAERIYQTAYATIGDGNDVDEEVLKMKRGYIKALKTLLGYHLMAAEEAGATSEVEEIKKLKNSLP